ncbi:hypothetical protein [Blastococcus litoris]|uniref:hypothetical protein n=1 Tax=Blastococcus litoris TaxID=2171622 RepID=UPI000E30A4DB|nr:hypothetical protein [Blastococcus litoris]
MKTRLRFAAIAVAAAVPLSLSTGVASAYDTPSYPPPPYEQTGGEGCTPGYWKNHTDSWERYAPSSSVRSVFSAATGDLGSATLLQALSSKGGNGVDGASRILLRAATAAVLNAADDDVDYAFTSSRIIADVNAALRTGDRSVILALATTLDDANNAGCTLN